MDRKGSYQRQNYNANSRWHRQNRQGPREELVRHTASHSQLPVIQNEQANEEVTFVPSNTNSEASTSSWEPSTRAANFVESLIRSQIGALESQVLPSLPSLPSNNHVQEERHNTAEASNVRKRKPITDETINFLEKKLKRARDLQTVSKEIEDLDTRLAEAKKLVVEIEFNLAQKNRALAALEEEESECFAESLSSAQSQCPICYCLVSLESVVIINPCGHRLCGDCLKQLCSFKCPACNQHFQEYNCAEKVNDTTNFLTFKTKHVNYPL